MSDTHGKTADLDRNKRIGPEEESREDQMEDDGLGPADADEDEPGLPGETAQDTHGIERSNDLTTP